METKIEILKTSLKKKAQYLDAAYSERFAHGRASNGQPMNDKQNGNAWFSKGEQLDASIRSKKADLERTKAALEREAAKEAGVALMKDILPAPLLEAVEEGALIQWRKHPNTFFVPGIDKARIIWVYKGRKKNYLAYKYLHEVQCAEERKKFIALCKELNKKILG